jgi:hypothetical protein
MRPILINLSNANKDDKPELYRKFLYARMEAKLKDGIVLEEN